MNTGLFAQILENGNTAWISSGGAADNDFFTIYHGIHMSTARKTGSAGAGNILRGARIFKLQQNADATLVVMASQSVDEQGNKNAGHTIRYPPVFGFGY